MSSGGGGADFYTVLADHYDELFGCSAELIAFLAGEGARPGARVLDVACGTGACTRALLSRGVDCYGVDLSARMIERGRALARAAGLDAGRFDVGDMRAVDEHRAAPFDLVFCIGNSISHLPSRVDVERFVRSARLALGTPDHDEPDGRPAATLVLQFLDVGELAIGVELRLPDLRARTAVMRRTYRRVERDRVVFDASLEPSDAGALDISQELLVLATDEVASLLTRHGFGDTRVFGGFDRSPARRDGLLRVVAARAQSMPVNARVDSLY